MTSQEVPLLLDGPCGQLEARYQNNPQAKGLALVCHPNPVQGGSMLNKVVSTLQRTARDAGYSTLRFNYRGVGASSGRHCLATGEVDDAETALAWLCAQQADLPVTLLGFSFGGYVAAALAARLAQRGETVQHLIMVAPAVGRLPADVGLPAQMRLTLIQPEQDEVISADQVYAWSAGLSRDHELLKVAECGHFFHGKLVELKELVQARL
ncbi:alpha/beta hydrolase [Pseudomonas sp. N040]|uniref:alpha/beta hydrolase n=1 Tax=Pseudomonas sp. N040 TaxID=2785325 RepID=UPI0018A2A51A|nr:alpha/beta fold hydrolase [Pseudomonas sp. N040]MBF7730324.1 alpha/beta fold hydrolase [Pseudomonas sp. N040]MBW7013966.1 alpha/beta fold hydrolase [Pseudomonas sp. N040]